MVGRSRVLLAMLALSGFVVSLPSMAGASTRRVRRARRVDDDEQSIDPTAPVRPPWCTARIDRPRCRARDPAAQPQRRAPTVEHRRTALPPRQSVQPFLAPIPPLAATRSVRHRVRALVEQRRDGGILAAREGLEFNVAIRVCHQGLRTGEQGIGRTRHVIREVPLAVRPGRLSGARCPPGP